MFIAAKSGGCALRQEGDVNQTISSWRGTATASQVQHGPPERRAQPRLSAAINMALLAEGATTTFRGYKHGPPGGGHNRHSLTTDHWPLTTDL
jgi:hypothetical protein